MSKDFGVAHQVGPADAEIDALNDKLRYARDDLSRARREHTELKAERDALKAALVDMAYGYLRIQEIGPQSAFAGRAFKAACELVDVDTSKAWVSEHELAQLAVGHDCARRAIDTGQLEQVGWRFERGRAFPGSQSGWSFIHYLPGETGHAEHERVYRLVTESETSDGR